MTKRQIALDRARICGYHNDKASFTRLYCESRVSLQAMNEAWRSGQSSKLSGVPCSCFFCKSATIKNVEETCTTTQQK